MTATTGATVSADGATIGYRQLGEGPGLVVLHGAMSSAHNHAQLAEALADRFTVTIPDRRGRGLSAGSVREHGIRQEVEDLRAVLAATGAHHVFGVSSGGLIALQAALLLPDVHRVAVFEPPLVEDHSWATAALAKLDRELAEGSLASALVTGMQEAEMGPRALNVMPSWLLTPLVRMAIRSEDRKGAGEYVPMRELAPTLHDDFQLVVELAGRVETFRGIRQDTLLLGGSKSPAYLTRALDRLAGIVARPERVELPGVGHAASWNSDRGGRPEPVARELRRFFGPAEASGDAVAPGAPVSSSAQATSSTSRWRR